MYGNNYSWEIQWPKTTQTTECLWWIQSSKKRRISARRCGGRSLMSVIWRNSGSSAHTAIILSSFSPCKEIFVTDWWVLFHIWVTLGNSRKYIGKLKIWDLMEEWGWHGENNGWSQGLFCTDCNNLLKIYLTVCQDP